VARCLGRSPLSGYLEVHMLRWAPIFFIVALIAAVFGFFGIAAAAAGVAKLLFFILSFSS
jgi:uncharacterized membrane protein YtjA (UPF0391 family)